MGNWWCNTQDPLPAGVMIVTVICPADKSHLTHFSGDPHATLLYLIIGNI